MTALHLVHLPIDLKRLNQWAGTRDAAWTQTADRHHRRLVTFDEGRALHHLLGETFGRGALQPFRLMVSRGRTEGSLYAYSSSNASTLIETARESALPDALTVCGLDRLAVKPMPEAWKVGKRLSFDLRARPVRRLQNPIGNFRKGVELDAYLVEVLRLFPEGVPDEANQPSRCDVYREWLSRRIGDSAEVENARLVHFSRSRVARKDAGPEGPDATIQGDLVIQDPLGFAMLLTKGVGRHTAYGYGMLLLRPAGSG